jgi:hypothetical protein
MGFSGIRAVILIVVLVGLLAGISKYDLPGWILPVGLVAVGALLKGAEQKASAK